MNFSRTSLSILAGCLVLLAAANGVGAATNSVPRPVEASTGRGSALPWFRVPLDSSNRWQVLHYKNIPANKTTFSKSGLEISVRDSASPLVYPLEKPLLITRVRVKAKLEGTLEVNPARQEEKGSDDYVLRIGLVVPGERKLTFVQRKTAPDWIKALFKLAPAGTGISRVQFFNVAAAKDQIGKTRQHPASDLLHEKVVAVPGPNGVLDFSFSLDQPIETLAIWISSDGDDTKSQYRVQLRQLEFEVK